MNAEDATDSPQSPTLVAPRDASVVNGREVTFVWEPVAEADVYRLQVAPTARFEDPLLDEEVGEETAVTVGNQFPTDGESFFWRVLAGTEGRWSEDSNVESFLAVTEEEAEKALKQGETSGPVTELARASRRTVTDTAFELEDRFEREKERGVAYEGVAAGQIMGISAAIIAVILVAVAIIFGWFGQVRQETRAEAAQGRDYREIRELREGGEEQLQEYRVVDEGEGVYSIPIDRAMDLIVNEEYQQQQESQQ